jgi:cytochrome c oxidase subunit 2
VDERMVVPVGAVVKLIVTSADVLHAFWVPLSGTRSTRCPDV